MPKRSPKTSRDDFHSKVVAKLAERAGYICCNPTCNTITVGPSEEAPGLSAKRGKASHIHAAATGGPRYDANQTSEQRASIENAIWLCSNCADLIDKNKGIDYPSAVLHRWKLEHEKMISRLLKSGSSPLSLIRKHTKEGAIAEKVLEYLNGRGALFVLPEFERNEHVVQSMGEIRARMTEFLHTVDQESPLYGRIQCISEHCRQYMNEMSTQNDFELMAMRLHVTRKGIGIVLKTISEQYGIRTAGNLITIMPS